MKNERLQWLTSRPASHWAGNAVCASLRKLERVARIQSGERPQELDETGHPTKRRGTSRKRHRAPGNPRHHRG